MDDASVAGARRRHVARSFAFLNELRLRAVATFEAAFAGDAPELDTVSARGRTLQQTTTLQLRSHALLHQLISYLGPITKSPIAALDDATLPHFQRLQGFGAGSTGYAAFDFALLDVAWIIPALVDGINFTNLLLEILNLFFYKFIFSNFKLHFLQIYF